MNNLRTADIGFRAGRHEIERRGGTDVVEHKEGNKRFITFTGLDGKHYEVTTRSKAKGTWQTSITYGKPRKENVLENEFWLFIDLTFDSPKFYPVPLWWISNDIYEKFQALLKKHGGHRKYNDNSIHHAIQLYRIKRWENRWSNIGLK